MYPPFDGWARARGFVVFPSCLHTLGRQLSLTSTYPLSRPRWYSAPNQLQTDPDLCATPKTNLWPCSLCTVNDRDRTLSRAATHSESGPSRPRSCARVSTCGNRLESQRGALFDLFRYVHHLDEKTTVLPGSGLKDKRPPPGLLLWQGLSSTRKNLLSWRTPSGC